MPPLKRDFTKSRLKVIWRLANVAGRQTKTLSTPQFIENIMPKSNISLKTQAELNAGLSAWVSAYKVARASGSVLEAKQIKANIEKAIADKNLDAPTVWGHDPDTQ